MGVNIATFRQFYFLRPKGEKRNFFYDALLPVAGFLVCFFIWISLPLPAKIIGGIWFMIGLVYLIIRTKGISEKPVEMNFKDI
jgi:hypothetical protein